LCELQDPYDLPFPDDYLTPWRSRRPEYVIVVDQLRGWQPGGPPSLFELWNPVAPENRNPTWKPNHEPHLEGTGTTLTINDTTMTSDQNPHTARSPARMGSVLGSLISHHYQFRGETGLHGPGNPPSTYYAHCGTFSREGDSHSLLRIRDVSSICFSTLQ
jgi:hypothetical protein